MAPTFPILAAALALPSLALAAAIPQRVETEADKIVGGTAASRGEFPFIVSLQTPSGDHFCGGSLLDEQTVITAGHCVEGQTAEDINIRAGTLTFASGGSKSAVSDISIHPKFQDIDFDVAILRLSDAIPSSNGTIGFVTLPEAGSDPSEGEEITVAGWGTTSEGGQVSPRLLKVSIPVVSREACQAAYSDAEITEQMWCAGTEEGGKDSCQGDSGGPVVDESGTLVGLVSWGNGCAQPGVPGVYARVSQFLDFIGGAEGGNGTTPGGNSTIV